MCNVMTRHSRAKHAAAHVPGYALDTGAQRKREAAGRPLGAHGVLPHRGARESQPMSAVRAWVRSYRGSFPHGLHGVR